ncbi:hypothetical protein ACFV98_04535 [Streptomyces violascens]|uniref:hypothetical protein n=1 Tax=Streptomyces violascens TaxID=67381 RepID=UPI003655D18C
MAIAAGLGLALTGFSSHGSHGKSHSSGGGCSNSHKSNGSSSGGSSDDSSSSSSGSSSSGGSRYNGNRYDSNNTTGSTSSGSTPSGNRTATPTTYVVTCASAAKGETNSTIKVSTGSGSSGSRSYQVRVMFYDKAGAIIDRGTATVSLGPNASSTVKVPMSKPALLAQVDLCGSEATAD